MNFNNKKIKLEISRNYGHRVNIKKEHNFIMKFLVYVSVL